MVDLPPSPWGPEGEGRAPGSRRSIAARPAGGRLARRGAAAFFVLFGAIFAAPRATALDGSPWPRGPLRVRNQFPLALHFLSFPGEDASVSGTGAWAVSVDLTAANVFSASRELERIRAGGERRALERAELDALVAEDPGRDLFLFDGGVGRLALALRYGVSERLELGLELPFVSLGGGALDGTIEGFHDTFGFSQSGRLGYPRDRLEVAVHLSGNTLFLDERDATAGLGDAVASAKLLVAREGTRRPQAALRLAIKPATGEGLLSSGHTDVGLNLAAAKHFSRRAVYLNAGYVVSGGWWAMPELDIADVWSLLVAYEQRLGRASFVVQTLSQSSPLAGATSSGLSQPSHEVTLGLRFASAGRFVWAVSLTENYGTFESSPDFGVHLGVERTVSAKRERGRSKARRAIRAPEQAER